MAAPPKRGLDYYPRDVGLLKDRKFIKAKIKYGYLAIVVFDALLEMIYSDKGYYLDYKTEEDKELVAWDILDSVRGKYPVEADTICEVIEMLVECRLFSHYHFKQGIITSKRIQETYYKCTVERKNVEVDKRIWILDVGEMKSLSTKSSILLFFKGKPNNEDNQPNNEDNQPNNPQSKVKESKVNKNIYIIYNTDIENVTRDNCLDKFKQLTGEQEISNKNQILLDAFTGNIDDKLFYYILLEAENNRDKWERGMVTSYITKKSMDFMKAGIRTYEEFTERGVKNE